MLKFLYFLFISWLCLFFSLILFRYRCNIISSWYKHKTPDVPVSPPHSQYTSTLWISTITPLCLIPWAIATRCLRMLPSERTWLPSAPLISTQVCGICIFLFNCALQLRRVQRLPYVPPSLIFKILHCAHREHGGVFYGSRNKERLFLYTAIDVSFKKESAVVYYAVWTGSLDITQISERF